MQEDGSAEASVQTDHAALPSPPLANPAEESDIADQQKVATDHITTELSEHDHEKDHQNQVHASLQPDVPVLPSATQRSSIDSTTSQGVTHAEPDRKSHEANGVIEGSVKSRDATPTVSTATAGTEISQPQSTGADVAVTDSLASIPEDERQGGDPEFEIDSSPLVSSSDSSELSSTSSSSDDEVDDDYELLDPAEQARRLMAEDAGSGDEGSGPSGPFRTVNERPDEEVIAKPDISITPEMKIELLGHVENTIGSLVLVKAYTTGEYRVLDFGSPLCLEDRTIIGAVAETLGRVQQPFYSIRFTNVVEIEKLGLQKAGVAVYYPAPFAEYIFTEPLKAIKGSDASNLHDEEIGDDEMEFSDDEAEAEHKRRVKEQRKARRDGREADGSGAQRHQGQGVRGAGGRGGRGSGRTRGSPRGRGDRTMTRGASSNIHQPYAASPLSIQERAYAEDVKLDYDDTPSGADGVSNTGELYTPLSRPAGFSNTMTPLPQPNASANTAPPQGQRYGRGGQPSSRSRGNFSTPRGQADSRRGGYASSREQESTKDTIRANDNNLGHALPTQSTLAASSHQPQLQAYPTPSWPVQHVHREGHASRPQNRNHPSNQVYDPSINQVYPAPLSTSTVPGPYASSLSASLLGPSEVAMQHFANGAHGVRQEQSLNSSSSMPPSTMSAAYSTYPSPSPHMPIHQTQAHFAYPSHIQPQMGPLSHPQHQSLPIPSPSPHQQNPYFGPNVAYPPQHQTPHVQRLSSATSIHEPNKAPPSTYDAHGLIPGSGTPSSLPPGAHVNPAFFQQMGQARYVPSDQQPH